MVKCLNPVDAWICGSMVCKDGVKSPKLVFSPNDALAYHITSNALDKHYCPQACGKCAACQIRKRKDMTVRLSHERVMHDDACFITLTYNEDSLPKTDLAKWNDASKIPCLWRGGDFGEPTLLPADVQLFLKRLRRHLEYIPKKKTSEVRDHVESGKIRYFAVGEYGTKSRRPHYHIIIFGWKPSDCKIHEVKKNYTICRSSQIEKLWRYGFSTVCDVQYGVVKYCARYVTKKFARLEHPSSDDVYVCPEFSLQSTRKGGIGSLWLDKYHHSLSRGFVTVRSGDTRISKCTVPKYYYNRLRKINLVLWYELRNERLDFVKSHIALSTAYDDLLRMCEVYRLLDRAAAEKEII